MGITAALQQWANALWQTHGPHRGMSSRPRRAGVEAHTLWACELAHGRKTRQELRPCSTLVRFAKFAQNVVPCHGFGRLKAKDHTFALFYGE
jgi:hypothetical protein